MIIKNNEALETFLETGDSIINSPAQMMEEDAYIKEWKDVARNLLKIQRNSGVK